MIKIKIIRKIRPKEIGRIEIDGEVFYEYQCKCGWGVGEGERYCACCGNGIDWTKKQTRRMKKIIKSL